jgi:hypothetical protein
MRTLDWIVDLLWDDKPYSNKAKTSLFNSRKPEFRQYLEECFKTKIRAPLNNKDFETLYYQAVALSRELETATDYKSVCEELRGCMTRIRDDLNIDTKNQCKTHIMLRNFKFLDKYHSFCMQFIPWDRGGTGPRIDSGN